MQRSSKHWLAVGLMLIVTALGASCKLLKKDAAGDKCSTEGKTQCDGTQSALLCRGGALVSVPCQGPKGCSGATDPILCDDNVGNVGDNCIEPAAPDQDFSCTADKTTMVLCKGGKFTAYDACRGEKGCSVTSSTSDKGGVTNVSSEITCDSSLMQAGDPCSTPDSHACSVDKKMWLVCKDGKMRAEASCHGPKGCVVTAGDKPNSHHLTCDDSFAEVGDPCAPEGRKTCSVDKTLWLLCKDGKMKADSSCRGPKGCTVTPGTTEPIVNHIECDDSLAQPGDPCEPEEERACSVDGKLLLQCKDAKYGTEKACLRGCTRKGTQLFCD